MTLDIEALQTEMGQRCDAAGRDVQSVEENLLMRLRGQERAMEILRVELERLITEGDARLREHFEAALAARDGSAAYLT